MNQGYYRPPATSRASATTQCQKCLKRDTYECKAPAQERPYKARPSRTAQLLNPKLAPKLTSDISNDLLRNKGVADEVLAAKASERGRKRSRSMESRNGKARKRSSRSVSSSSVSTISTAASRSVSPPPRRRPGSPDPIGEDGDNYMSSQNIRARDTPRKRPRRSLSASSNSSYASRSDRNTRRRRNSRSPGLRGRRRSRSSGENKSSFTKRRSRSASPHSARKRGGYHDGPGNGIGYGRTNGAYGNSGTRGPPLPPKERSLSPYSKRLALTQAMN